MSTKHVFLIAGCLALLAQQVSTQGQTGGIQPGWAWTPEIRSVKAGEVQVVPVRGKVSMIVGGGANITVHAGNDGILMQREVGRACHPDRTALDWYAIRSWGAGGPGRS